MLMAAEMTGYVTLTDGALGTGVEHRFMCTGPTSRAQSASTSTDLPSAWVL